MDRGQVALRISAPQSEGFQRAGLVARLSVTAGRIVARMSAAYAEWGESGPGCRCAHPGYKGWLGPTLYLLQSFRSLSAIENTASALISMSRTKQCRAPA